MPDTTAREVARFWLEDVGPSGWYKVDEALDAEIRDRFLTAWEEAHSGDMFDWCICAESMFGFLILTDQFPRNMFRGEARAFATDALARTAAKMAVDRRWDMEIDEPERQFFYLPLMHSERLDNQDRCIRLMTERLPETGAENLIHARAHREIIRRFGRFPYRNAAIGRMTLPGEEAFLAEEGYAAVLNALKAEDDA
ncbi:uncharacterized protein (DUF924 family) [Aliiruegeria haliotis]|uniref:Uncharacterized protein (DUF924 family) n=1 Tax=Aliiruegeria haliotis TaxID=1280846 RepID=A0A2T0RNI1_9RHOB|nr:DUF924 family protein [Aliiruegeria haliotis]PRY22687.1 uncharacterized protein (DUF924 family) [Aliiruegeria haliotis]